MAVLHFSMSFSHVGGNRYAITWKILSLLKLYCLKGPSEVPSYSPAVPKRGPTWLLGTGPSLLPLLSFTALSHPCVYLFSLGPRSGKLLVLRKKVFNRTFSRLRYFFLSDSRGGLGFSFLEDWFCPGPESNSNYRQLISLLVFLVVTIVDSYLAENAVFF